MSAHRIIIEPGSRPRVECVTPAQCTGLAECREDHGEYEPDDNGEVYGPNGIEYNHGDTAMIHGVIHTLRWSYDWMVPYGSCVVAANLGGIDLPDEIDQDRRGVWEVEDGWDEDLFLTLTREITDTRCPSCGGLAGAHGLVHTRHANGGGANHPCPLSDAGITDISAKETPA